MHTNPIKTHTSRRAWMVALSAATLGLALSGNAQAQTWPTKPVRIVLAIAAGSSGDTFARMMAPRLEAIWSQSVIVENRPGAGGVVGTEHVVRSDDHTILLGTQSSILPRYVQKLRFDPLSDLIPVRKLLNYQMVIAANGDVAKQVGSTFQGLLDFSHQGEGLFLSGLGPTAIFNLSFAVINRQLGMQYSSVNFNNVNEANLAVVRGDTQFIFNNPASVRPFFGNGALVPLVAISAQRYASLPDVPTLGEAVGYGGYIPQIWTGFFVPKATSMAVVEKINRDVATMFEDAQFRAQVEQNLTATVAQSSPAIFAQELHEETAVWQELFTALKIQPE